MNKALMGKASSISKHNKAGIGNYLTIVGKTETCTRRHFMSQTMMARACVRKFHHHLTIRYPKGIQKQLGS